ncbi:MAG: hypothetical protein FWD27_00095 [Coriobacteriia bacterium]|nr:hypothetical protein [Coriobacteriia bacterium]
MVNRSANTQSGQQYSSVQASGKPTMGHRPSFSRSVSMVLSSLSTREKAMIWALLVITLILALVFFLILPAQDRLVLAQNERDALRFEQTSTRSTIAAISTNQDILTSATERHDEHLLKYQAPLLPESIDRMITTMVQDCGFTASSLTLNALKIETITSFEPAPPSWEIPNPQASSSELQPQGNGDATGGSEPEVGESTHDLEAQGDDASLDNEGVSLPPMNNEHVPAAPSVEHEVQVYEVQISVVGEEAHFYALLDRVVPLSWIKVVSSSYTPPGGYLTNSSPGAQSCTLTFKVYVHADATAKNI